MMKNLMSNINAKGERCNAVAIDQVPRQAMNAARENAAPAAGSNRSYQYTDEGGDQAVARSP